MLKNRMATSGKSARKLLETSVQYAQFSQVPILVGVHSQLTATAEEWGAKRIENEA